MLDVGTRLSDLTQFKTMTKRCADHIRFEGQPTKVYAELNLETKEMGVVDIDFNTNSVLILKDSTTKPMQSVDTD